MPVNKTIVKPGSMPPKLKEMAAAQVCAAHNEVAADVVESVWHNPDARAELIRRVHALDDDLVRFDDEDEEDLDDDKHYAYLMPKLPDCLVGQWVIFPNRNEDEVGLVVKDDGETTVITSCDQIAKEKVLHTYIVERRWIWGVTSNKADKDWGARPYSLKGRQIQCSLDGKNVVAKVTHDKGGNIVKIAGENNGVQVDREIERSTITWVEPTDAEIAKGCPPTPNTSAE